jgi:hypothetical protein
MKLFIPSVGYRLKLTEDWTFSLYSEWRNRALQEALKLGTVKPFGMYSHRYPEIMNVTLPKETILEVDRVYIRATNKNKTGDDDYDSLTFKIIDCPTINQKKVRFWAKLNDVNNIQFFVENDDSLKNVKKQRRTKLGPKLIVSQILHDISKNKPVYWLTKETIDGFQVLASEYKKRHLPRVLKELDLLEKTREKREREAFERGELHVPVAAAKLSFDEYVEWKKQRSPVTSSVNENLYDWRYFIPWTFLSSSESTYKFTNGVHSRQYRFKKHDAFAEFSDMWITVVTNEDDSMITSVMSGID